MPECRDARTCPRRAECVYARVFEPAAAGRGPSGLSDRPRPFVFRVRHLDGAHIPAGAEFEIGLNVFEPPVAEFEQALGEMLRGRAELAERLTSRLTWSLEPDQRRARRVRVEFLTPTELKAGERLAAQPGFRVLFARIRDRLSTLRALYGPGPLEIDFRAMGERAARVRTTACELHRVETERRSARTGQVHPLGGFTGWAEYEGELGEFLPHLEAARWTGVGRHTVWGNGEIAVAKVE
ncbi:MAG: CRISPR system precrRNA processing endoribonuclease RAMP protein Cas6 [Bryobacteraceae bacterium]